MPSVEQKVEIIAYAARPWWPAPAVLQRVFRSGPAR